MGLLLALATSVILATTGSAMIVVVGTATIALEVAIDSAPALNEITPITIMLPARAIIFAHVFVIIIALIAES